MYSQLTEEKTDQRNNLNETEPCHITHSELRQTSSSAPPPAGNNANSAPDAVSEFSHIILFSLLSEVSGLPQDFYRSLTQIVHTNDTIVKQLRALNSLLERVRQQTSGDLRSFIDSYLELVRQAMQLQQHYQTGNRGADNLPTFLNTLSERLNSDIIRSHLPESLVTQAGLMIKRSQAATSLLQDLAAGTVPADQFIAYIRRSELLPGSVQTMLDSVEKLIALHQHHPLPAENSLLRLDWLADILRDEQASSLLNDFLPAELSPVLLKVIAAAQQINSYWQNNASWSEWFSWLAENAVGLLNENDRTLLRAWLLAPESRLHQLLKTADTLSSLARTHPLPSREELPGWLLTILSDVNTHSVLKTFLPARASEMLEASAPLLRFVNRYPAGMPVSHQLSWVASEYRSPSPELQLLISQLPLDAFISQLRLQISEYVINPDILDFLLTLADPQTSVKEKSVMLFRQLSGFIDLQQAVRYVVRNYVPRGELMLGLWDWYQTLPEHLSWSETLSHLTTSLQQQWPQEAALMSSLVTGTWQEVGEKAFRLALECSPEVKWITLRYMELSILWAGRGLLTASDNMTREKALRDLSAAVHRYFSTLSVTVPQALPDILRELELLLTLRDDISNLPKDNGWLSWTGGLIEILERHPQANRLQNRIVEGVTDTVNSLLGENMAETSREIMQLLGSRFTRQPAAGPSLTTNIPHTEKSSREGGISNTEQGEKGRPGVWLKPQPRQNLHHSRANLRRRHQKRRQFRGYIHQPTVNIPLSRPATERLTTFIRPGTLRNAALGVAGLYLFSQFGTTEASRAEDTPAEDRLSSTVPPENENVFYLINEAGGPGTFTAEIDGERYVLSPSEFDTASNWQKVWSKLSILSLTMAVLSVPGLLTYRYFLRKKNAALPAGRENEEGTELQVIEVHSLPPTTGENIAESGPATGHAQDNDRLPETPLLPQNFPAGSGAAPAANWRNNMPEIAALVLVMTGSGGYLYSRQQAKYYDRRAEQLLNEEQDFDPFIEVTPNLLKHYRTESSGDIEEGEVSSQEIAFLLAGEQASDHTVLASRAKRDTDEQSPTGKEARSRTERGVNTRGAFADSKISPSLQALVGNKWNKNDSFLPTSSQMNNMVHSKGLYRSGETWFIKISGEFWVFEPTNNNFDRGFIKNLPKRDKIAIFSGRNQTWTANSYEATLREGETLIIGQAADSPASLTLKNLVTREWKKDESYSLTSDQKNNLISSGNLYRAGEHYFLKINNEFWFFEPENNKLDEGHLKNLIQKTKIKVFPDKVGYWTTNRYAEALKEGEALIDRLITWHDYSDKFKTLLRKEIEFILKDKNFINTSTFKNLLTDTLALLFFRNSKDIPLGLEILKSINEINRNNTVNTAENANLFQLTNEENAAPEIYHSLLNDEIDDDSFYKNALDEFKGGQGIFSEAETTLTNSKLLLNNTLIEIDKKLSSLADEIRQKETLIQSQRDFNSQGDTEFTVNVNDIRKKLAIQKEKQNSYNVKREEIAKNFDFRMNKLEELQKKLNEEKIKQAPSIAAYKEGINLAEKYAKGIPLDLKNYNKIMFKIINDEYKESDGNYIIPAIRKKYAAAKYHLNKIHSLYSLLEKLVNIIPETLSGILLNSWLVMEKKNDYRDILISEEAAALYYHKNEQYIDSLFQEYSSGFDKLDVNMIIAAIFFYKLRKNIANSSLKEIRLDDITQFYFAEKSNKNPLGMSSDIPEGFYTVNNFKKRNTFPDQYQYNEQFNVYMDKYMDYDIHMRMLYSLGEAKIPRYLLLSPFSSVHYFIFHDESGNRFPTDLTAKERGGGVSIKLENDDWLLVFSIDGIIKSLYVPRTDIKEDFYNIFIEPNNNHFGIRREANTRGNVVPLGDRYPPDNISETKLNDYTYEWLSLGYNFSGYPVFLNVPSSPFSVEQEQTTLEYLHKFFSYHHKNLINSYKQSLDETGFWHRLATAVIPFYGVIYGAITDRYYQLSAGDVISIVFDILSVLGCLITMGIKVAQITDNLATSLTVKYNELLKSGINRNAALLQIVADYPSLMTKTAVIPFLATLRKEIINIFNPTPFDINDFASRLYDFTTSEIVSITGKVKNSVLNLPTKLNRNWRLKDPQLIDKIKMEGTLRNSIYELDNAPGNISNSFIKQGDDFYPVVQGDGDNSWYLTNSAVSQEIKIEQPVFERNGVWTTNPVSEGDLITNISHYNVSRVKKSVPVTATTQTALNQKNIFKKITRYMQEVDDYVTDSDFAVVPVGNGSDFSNSLSLPLDIAQNALTSMKQKGQDLTNASKQMSMNDEMTLHKIETSTELSNEYNIMLTENNTKNVLLYALVKKTSNWQNDPDSVYGMAKLHYNLSNGELILDSLLSHPCIFAAKSKSFSSLIAQDETLKYKIKNVTSHISGSSAKEAIAYIHSFPGEYRLRTFSATSASPATLSLISNLNMMNDQAANPARKINTQTIKIMDDIRQVLGRGNGAGENRHWLPSVSDNNAAETLAGRLLSSSGDNGLPLLAKKEMMNVEKLEEITRVEPANTRTETADENSLAPLRLRGGGPLHSRPVNKPDLPESLPVGNVRIFREKIQADNNKIAGNNLNRSLSNIMDADRAVATVENNRPYMAPMSDDEIEQAKEEVMRDLLSNPLAELELNKITEAPEGNCDKAAAKILEYLSGKGYDLKVIGVLSYEDILDKTPGDHYVVVAGKNERSLVIDSTFVQYSSTSRRDWVITSWEKWKEKLISSDHLRNKFIISKEYPSLQLAKIDIGTALDQLPWLATRYAQDDEFLILQMPEYYLRALKVTYRNDINFLNSENGLSKILNIDNKIKKQQNKLAKLLKIEYGYTMRLEPLPGDIQEKIMKTRRKIREDKDKRYLPRRINNYLKLIETNPDLKVNDVKLSPKVYNQLTSSVLVEKIPNYRKLLDE